MAAAAMRLDVPRAIISMSFAVAVVGAIWIGVFRLIPSPPPILATPGPLIASALALAALFTVLLMIEAIAHERLVSDAFNPLAGHDSNAMKINQRVLQNSLEQYLVYAAGVGMLGTLYEPAVAYRAVLAATVSWILSRWLFWFGYRIGPQNRVAGLVGAAQSMVVLLVAMAHLGASIGGLIGAFFVPALYGAGELLIGIGLWRHRRR